MPPVVKPALPAYAPPPEVGPPPPPPTSTSSAIRVPVPPVTVVPVVEFVTVKLVVDTILATIPLKLNTEGKARFEIVKPCPS